MITSYDLTLPLPPSVNATHTVGRGFKDPKTKKWKRNYVRSADYTKWIKEAGISYRSQFPAGVPRLLKGRIRVEYIFIWNIIHTDIVGRAVGELSDISNREKALSDFLESKFFDNDNQIDEQHHYRRITKTGPHKVIIRVTEIPDTRLDPVDLVLIFKPKQETTMSEEKENQTPPETPNEEPKKDGNEGDTAPQTEGETKPE